MSVSLAKQAIILGRGESLSYIENNNLWYKIADTLVIGCNLITELYTPDILAFLDSEDMYSIYYNFIKDFKNIIVSKPCANKPVLKCLDHFEISPCSQGEFCAQDGIEKDKLYGPAFTGLYAISLAISLGIEEIFLIGFDGVTNGSYKEFSKEGVQEVGHVVSAVAQKPLDQRYICFKKFNITNVSLNSSINIFPKCSFEEMVEKLNNNKPSLHTIQDFITQRRNGWLRKNKK